MRIVLDTNILVSALITRGTPPDLLYRAWLRGEVELVTSAAQIDDVADVLARAHAEIRRPRRGGAGGPGGNGNSIHTADGTGLRRLPLYELRPDINNIDGFVRANGPRKVKP